MVVIFIRLVYHDAPLVRLELEVTDAILLDVLHHIRKHRLDEVCTCIAVVAILGTQAFTEILLLLLFIDLAYTGSSMDEITARWGRHIGKLIVDKRAPPYAFLAGRLRNTFLIAM